MPTQIEMLKEAIAEYEADGSHQHLLPHLKRQLDFMKQQVDGTLPQEQRFQVGMLPEVPGQLKRQK